MGQAPTWWTEQIATLARKAGFSEVAEQLAGSAGGEFAFEIAKALAPDDAFLIDCTVFNEADPAFWPAIDKLARRMTSFISDPGKPSTKGVLNHWSSPAAAVPWGGSWWTTEGKYIQLDGQWFTDGHFAAEVRGRDGGHDSTNPDIEWLWSDANRGKMWQDKIQPIRRFGDFITDGMSFYSPIYLALAVRILGYPIWVEDRMLESHKPLALRSGDGRRSLVVPVNVARKKDGSGIRIAETMDQVDWTVPPTVGLGRRQDKKIEESREKKAERAAATPKLRGPTGGRIEMFDASVGLPAKAAGASLARMLLSAPLRVKQQLYVGAQVVGDEVYVSDGHCAVLVPIDSPFIPPIPAGDGVYSATFPPGGWEREDTPSMDIHQLFIDQPPFVDPVVAVEFLSAAEGGTWKDGVMLVSAEGRVGLVNPKMIWATGLLIGGPPFGLLLPPGVLRRIDPNSVERVLLPPSKDEQDRFYAPLGPIKIVGPDGRSGLIMPLKPAKFWK